MALKESTLDKEQMNTRVTLDPSKVGVQRPTELSAADEGLVTPTMRDRALRSDPVKGTGTVNIGEDNVIDYDACRVSGNNCVTPPTCQGDGYCPEIAMSSYIIISY